MKCLHLALGLAQFGGGREAFAHSLTVDFAGQAEVGAVARLARLMTMAVRFTATTMNCRDGAAAQITRLQDLGQNAGRCCSSVATESGKGHLQSQRMHTLGL